MKTSLKKLYTIVSDKVFYIYTSIFLAIFTSFLSLKGPLLLGDLTNTLVKGLSFNKEGVIFNIDYPMLRHILFLIILLYLTVFIFSILQGVLLSKVSTLITYRLRQKINDKINRIPLSILDKRKDGDTISLIVNDVSTLSNAIYTLISSVLPSVITIVGTLILMFYISFSLTLIVIVLVPIIIVTMMSVMKLSYRYFKELQEKLAKLNAYINEMYNCHDVVIAFNGQDMAIDEFKKINESLFKASFLSQFLSGLAIPIVTTLNNINYALVSLLGSVLIFKNTINIGKFQTFIQYLNGFHRPLSLLSQVATNIQQIRSTSARISDFLSLEELDDENDLKELDIDKFSGNISFKNVSFSYDKGKKILNNISFDVKAGQKIAIVGHTGSGKTTIINLLMKFYDIDSGDILIDGVSIKDIKRTDISKLFTMVLQDTWLFEGSVADNIKFGTNKKVSFEDIKNACISANSHHFINILPKAYDTMLNEQTSNLSDGEKQLLTISRAFLKDSKILILDEATSSIDSRTEKLIQKSMADLAKNRTSFIIAHRLSTIKEADIIILLDKGEIIEMGTHDSLIKLNKEYAKLYKS